MKYKIYIANKEADIDEDEIEKVIKAIQKGGIVVLRHVIFNSAYFQAIIPDKEATRDNLELKSYGYKADKKVSEFAKLLSPKMKMLSDQERTRAQEEASKLERKLKY